MNHYGPLKVGTISAVYLTYFWITFGGWFARGLMLRQQISIWGLQVRVLSCKTHQSANVITFFLHKKSLNDGGQSKHVTEWQSVIDTFINLSDSVADNMYWNISANRASYYFSMNLGKVKIGLIYFISTCSFQPRFLKRVYLHIEFFRPASLFKN